SSWSRLPLIWVRSSSVSWPHFSLTLPLNCFQFPSMRSQFIANLLCLRVGKRAEVARSSDADRSDIRVGRAERLFLSINLAKGCILAAPRKRNKAACADIG